MQKQKINTETVWMCLINLEDDSMTWDKLIWWFKEKKNRYHKNTRFIISLY